MSGASEHAAVVSAWQARVTSGARPERMAQALEEAFDALWHRASVTLGEVSLAAIVERVLHDTVPRFPILAHVKVSDAGPDVAPLRAHVEGLDADQIEGFDEAIKLVLVQFLVVLGRLTANVLTRALHRELVGLAAAAGGQGHGGESEGPSEQEDGEER